jgi:hypothetical protein
MASKRKSKKDESKDQTVIGATESLLQPKFNSRQQALNKLKHLKHLEKSIKPTEIVNYKNLTITIYGKRLETSILNHIEQESKIKQND